VAARIVLGTPGRNTLHYRRKLAARENFAGVREFPDLSEVANAKVTTVPVENGATVRVLPMSLRSWARDCKTLARPILLTWCPTMRRTIPRKTSATARTKDWKGQSFSAPPSPSPGVFPLSYK
jgi:hypothetical protein